MKKVLFIILASFLSLGTAQAVEFSVGAGVNQAVFAATGSEYSCNETGADCVSTDEYGAFKEGYPSNDCILCLYEARIICCLFVTEGFSNSFLPRNCNITLVFSNFFLYFFKALSMFSPSFIGIINIINRYF